MWRVRGPAIATVGCKNYVREKGVAISAVEVQMRLLPTSLPHFSGALRPIKSRL